MVLDLLGTLLSLLSTWYFIKVDRKAWLISIFATAINSVLYFQKGIFADTALELFYLSNSLYGFFLWGRNSTSADRIRRLSLTQTIKLLFLILALYSFIYFLLGQYTPSTVASLDALTCSLSIMGQWLMCYKVIFTWVIWFFTDAIYAYLYFHKQIPFHALLMLLYTIMAVLGYLTWSSYDVRLNQTKIFT
ncbi:nicotinamide riboside transporter PnuC [Legionella birminghamensis]|nr:nicotinamide riboside transporter PnuC [Legionella birminghamensis]